MQRSVPRRMRVALLATALAFVGVVADVGSAGAVGGGAPAAGPPGPSALVARHAIHADVPPVARTRSFAPGASVSAGTVGAAAVDSWPSEPCAVDSTADRSGDATGGVDLTGSELRFNCGTGRFTMLTRFAGPVQTKVSELALMFNTDLKPSGCGGVDVRISAVWVGRWELYKLTTPSCNQALWSERRLSVGSPFTDSSHAQVRFDASMLGSRSSFAWFAVVWSRSASKYSDTNPDDYWMLTAFFRPPFRIVPGDAGLTAAPSLVGVADVDGNGLSDVVMVGNGTDPDQIALRTYGAFTTGPALVVDGTYDTLLSGDFNDDGYGDVYLWGTGDLADQLLTGAADGSLTPTDWAQIGGSADAKLVSGDFDGDGADDLLLYGPGSEADRVFPGGPVAPVTSKRLDFPRAFAAVTSTDFNGDGASDLFLYNPGTAADRLAFGGPDFVFDAGPSIRFDLDYKTIRSGDFDGDGRDDLMMLRRNTSSGPTAVIAHSMPGYYYSRGVNAPKGTVPLVGRFDSGRTDDIVWFAPGLASDRLWTGILER